jgi:hypothetical protein
MTAAAAPVAPAVGYTLYAALAMASQIHYVMSEYGQPQ